MVAEEFLSSNGTPESKANNIHTQFCVIIFTPSSVLFASTAFQATGIFCFGIVFDFIHLPTGLKTFIKTFLMKSKFTIRISTAIVALTTALFMFLGCQKNDIPKEDQPYDLDVILNAAGKNPFSKGFIKFRQDPDTARIVDLNTWVFNLEPDHVYQLQRAVNPIADPTGCSSTAWLTLGLGLQPLSIHTDEHGNGNADFWRNLSAAPRGTSFHIHFQVIDAVSLAVVLTSDCYDFTVR